MLFLQFRDRRWIIGQLRGDDLCGKGDHPNVAYLGNQGNRAGCPWIGL